MTLQYLDTAIAFAVVLLGGSLLITVLNQMISALFAYRGANLLEGVRTLLTTIEPQLADKADVVARGILTQPIISDAMFAKCKDVPYLGLVTRRWQLATTITPEALAQGLRTVANELLAADPNTAALINNVIEASDPEAARKVRIVQAVFADLQPDYSVQVDKYLQQLGKSVQESVGKLEAFFHMAMDRAAQRFARHMRIWTVLLAVLLAFGAHLDSIELLGELWKNPTLRANLVASHEAILDQASVVLAVSEDGQPSGSPGVSPAILDAAWKKLLDKEKDVLGKQATSPPLVSLDETLKWLQTGLNVDDNEKQRLVAEYRSLVLAELQLQFEGIRQKLSDAGFQLIPSPYPGFHYKGTQNILGILITAALLSLGAPFWFNTLKALSNLRPLAATRQPSQPD